MKTAAFAVAALSTAASAHSWLGCTDQDISQMRGWMERNSTMKPPVLVDPGMPHFQHLCHGLSRSKEPGGNWIAESTNYVWNLVAEKAKGDHLACHPNQRKPSDEKTIPHKKPGEKMRLFFGGNGHTRGHNMPNNDPGMVHVYSKGSLDKNVFIKEQKDFTRENQIAEGKFNGDAYWYPKDATDPGHPDPNKRLVDKGNWLVVEVPKTYPKGKHMAVWVWSYGGQPQWSTCFDFMVI